MIGLIVTARMGSTRLHDKHLRDVGGRPALSHLLDRIEREFAVDIGAGRAMALIATGNEDRNRSLAALVEGRSFGVFYGDDDNVPLRHLQAAQRFGLEAIVSIDGDDIFCAPEAMREVARRLEHGSAVALTRGFPLGMNAYGYSRAALTRALADAPSGLLETGWGRIFDGVPASECSFECPQRGLGPGDARLSGRPGVFRPVRAVDPRMEQPVHGGTRRPRGRTRLAQRERRPQR